MFERAAEGSGGVALILGEPGIGKTALAREAVAGAPLTTCWAVGREGPGVPPFWMWTEIARNARTHGAPAIAGSLAGTSRSRGPMVGSGVDRFRFFDRVNSAIAEAARVTPLILAFDDLQWADHDSVELLEFVAAELADLPVAIVATIRRDEMPRLPRADLVLDLFGLGPPELRLLIEGVTGSAIGLDVAEAAGVRTAGNPLFVRELARLLRSSRRGFGLDEWQGALPESVRGVFVRRFARLPQQTADALAAASVVGVTADVTVVAALIDADRQTALDRLAPAVDAGLLQDSGTGDVAFTHALARDAALAGVGTEPRRLLHQRTAEILEALRGDRAAAEIATHLQAAGDRTAAATWAERAGIHSYALSMYADAAAWLERAVHGTDRPSAALLIRLGDARSRCGQLGAADANYLEAARLAREQRDFGALVRAALGLGAVGGPFEVRLLTPMHLSLLNEAMAAIGSTDSAERTILMARLSVASAFQETQERRVELAEDAVAMARRVGDPGATVLSLAAWCDAHAGPRHVDQRLVMATEMLDAAGRVDDPELEFLARRLLIVAHMERGDVAAASGHIRAFGRLADSLRQPRFTWFARVGEAMLALMAGDVDAAERLAQAASRDGRLAGSANAEMLADGALLAVIARDRGDAEQMHRYFSVNEQHAEAARALGLVTLFAAGHGADLEAVRDVVDRFPPIASIVSADDAIHLVAVSMIADGAALIGNVRRLDEAEAALAPYPDLFVLDGMAAVCYGPVSWRLARIAAARAEFALAAARYRRSIELLARCHAPLLTAQVTEELRRIESGRHWAGDQAVDSPAISAPGDPRERAGVFRRDGEIWEVAFGGTSALMKHRKGMGDLALLLASPGREFHVLDLVAASDGHPARGVASTGGDLGPLVDTTARIAYEARIRDLTEDIEEAESFHDHGRAELLDNERASLLAELAGSLGLGGRDRPQGRDSERARKSVSMRIASCVERIEHELPELGRHLRNSIRTGTFCSYQPERPLDWTVRPEPS